MRVLRWFLLQATVNLSLTQVVQAQLFKGPTQFETEIGGYTAIFNRTPFWQQTNQFGIVPTKVPILTIRASACAHYDSSRIAEKKLAIGYGFRIVGNAAPEGSLLIPELYSKVRYRALELTVGRRQEVIGLVDSMLSSGSYSWSGNALPMPKVQLAIPTFTQVPFTKGWVSVMGSFTHGYMNPTGFVNHSMLHQKTLYMRFGRPKDVVRYYSGFTHQAVWGGRIADFSLINNPDLAKESQLPSRFRDYVYVVSGLRLPGPDDEKRLTNFDYTNRIGNHLGNIDVGGDIDLVRYNLFFYRQSFFDDGSLYYLLNIADGLNGIRLRRNNSDALVRDILVEYLNTTSQGGSQFVVEEPLLRGRDNYFNHSQFRDGWTYRQRGIGTPFITPALGPKGEWPFGTFTNNNRVRVVHIGLAGSLPTAGWPIFGERVQYKAKLSLSQNYGTYDVPFGTPRPQFSGIINFSAPFSVLNGVIVDSSLAIDTGKLYTNNIGLYVGFRKVWYNSRNH